MSVWGVPEAAKAETKHTTKSKVSKMQKQTMTAKDIMRKYR